MRRSRGGCLSVVIFIVVLVICICLIYKMIDASSGGRGAEMIDSLITRITMTKKEKEMLKELEKEESGRNNGFESVFENLPDANVIKVQLSQEKMRELLQEKLDEVFPMVVSDLTLDSDGIMTIEAVMNRDDFLDFVDKSGSSLEGMQVLLLKLAPENLDVSCRFAISYSASDGTLNIDPEKLTVYKISIPVSLIPSSLTGKMNVAVNEYAAPYGYKLNSMSFYDGYIDIYIEQS